MTDELSQLRELLARQSALLEQQSRQIADLERRMTETPDVRGTAPPVSQAPATPPAGSTKPEGETTSPLFSRRRAFRLSAAGVGALALAELATASPAAAVTYTEQLRVDTTGSPGASAAILDARNMHALQAYTVVNESASSWVSAVTAQGSNCQGGSFYSNTYTGVMAMQGSPSGIHANAIAGVIGVSSAHSGVRGFSDQMAGVYGCSGAASGVSGIYAVPAGVTGESKGSIGVRGYSGNYFGVFGYSQANNGVVGQGRRGGQFTGSAANLNLKPSSSAAPPASGAVAGDVFVDSARNLWFHNGTAWRQVAFV